MKNISHKIAALAIALTLAASMAMADVTYERGNRIPRSSIKHVCINGLLFVEYGGNGKLVQVYGPSDVPGGEPQPVVCKR